MRRAHQRPGKFGFPHFLIIGFPKAATTSLHEYLKHHKQGLNPRIKARRGGDLSVFPADRSRDLEPAGGLHKGQAHPAALAFANLPFAP